MTTTQPEPVLLIDEQLESAQALDFAGGTVVFLTRRAPDKTTPNEDAIALLPLDDRVGVLVIADGCGGQANGQLASRLAVEALEETILAWQDPHSLRTPILDGFEAAARRVRELGTGAATTLIAVEINAGEIRTFHVGDSQAMVVGNRGKIKLQTRSHSPVGYAMEAGMLSEHAALQHEDRHLVSNVIGGEGSHIDMGLPRKLDLRDTVILGSDGLFDNLRQDEIVQLIRKGPIERAAATMAELVAQRMTIDAHDLPHKPDDLAIVIYRQNQPPRSRTPRRTPDSDSDSASLPVS